MEKIETTLERVIDDITTFYDYKKHFFSMVNGVDFGDRFEIYWIFSNYEDGKISCFCASAPQESEIPTISELIPSAKYSENELYDLMGIKFVGSKRGLFIESDTDGFPLRGVN